MLHCWKFSNYSRQKEPSIAFSDVNSAHPFPAPLPPPDPDRPPDMDKTSHTPFIRSPKRSKDGKLQARFALKYSQPGLKSPLPENRGTIFGKCGTQNPTEASNGAQNRLWLTHPKNSLPSTKKWNIQHRNRSCYSMTAGNRATSLSFHPDRNHAGIRRSVAGYSGKNLHDVKDLAPKQW